MHRQIAEANPRVAPTQGGLPICQKYTGAWTQRKRA